MTVSQTTAFQTSPGRNDDASRAYTRNRFTGGGDGQWSAIAAGAITGLAAGVLMAALGAALGLTATAAVADAAVTSQVANASDIGDAAVGFGIGAGIWLLLSAAVVGVVGGTVLAKMSNLSRGYSPGAHGMLTWSLGVAIAAMFAVSGSGAISTALGVGAAGAAGAASNAPGMWRSAEVGTSSETTPTSTNEARTDGSRPSTSTADRDAAPADAGFGRRAPALTPAERATAVRAAEVAATAAATAAWFALISLLIGLGATVGAANQRKFQPNSEAGLAHTA